MKSNHTHPSDLLHKIFLSRFLNWILGEIFNKLHHFGSGRSSLVGTKLKSITGLVLVSISLLISPVAEAAKNIKPLSKAGTDQLAELSMSVTLDGSQSYDPDGSLKKYRWTQTSGPTVSLTGAKTSTLSFMTPSKLKKVKRATLVFKLTVTDTKNKTGFDTVAVRVSAEPCAQPQVLQNGQCVTPTANIEVKSISAGRAHNCALLFDNSVKCWGLNNFGQLGLGDVIHRGNNPIQMGNNLPTVDLGSGRTAKTLALGREHSCAILDDDSVKCWGGNTFGQLGLGDKKDRGKNPNEMGDNLPVVDLGAGRSAKSIAAGYLHTCVVLDNNSVKCWGLGSLGYDDPFDTSRGDQPNEMGDNLPVVNLGSARTVKALTVGGGGAQNCALLDNDTIKCWGTNSFGVLGIESTIVSVGNNFPPGLMGDELLSIPLGVNRTVKTVSAGYSQTCAILDNNSLKCWGQNDLGLLGLGLGDTDDRGDGPNEMGDNLPSINLGSGRTVKTVVAGNVFICAILDTDAVKCWGSNHLGQLGLGDVANRGITTGEMGDSLSVIDLGTGRTALALTAGEYHTCALLDNKAVKCWGFNGAGAGTLGLGDFEDRGDNSGEMGDALPIVDLGP